MSDFSFGTKAETLKSLYENKDKVGINVLNPAFFTVQEWKDKSKEIMARITDEFEGKHYLIVRSSAKNEDSESASLAGMYESIICDNDYNSLVTAIERVITSYGSAQDDDQVLIQEAIKEVECSGVVFSREPSQGGYYFVVNYDDSIGSTASITSGTGDKTKLYYWFSKENEYPKERYLNEICKTVSELIKYTRHDALDIEFLFSKGKMYILQVNYVQMKT